MQSRIQGGIDVGLNEKGIEQAREVSRHFPADFSCDLLTSPLRRALETAEILEKQVKARTFEKPDFLRELDQGYWNGLRVQKLKDELDPERYQNWLDDPLKHGPPGGESLEEVKDRVSEGLKETIGKFKGPLVIVAHKVVNSIIAHLAGEWPLEEVMDSLPENAAVLEIELAFEEKEAVEIEK